MKKRNVLFLLSASLLLTSLIGVTSCNPENVETEEKEITVEGPSTIKVGESTTLVAKAGDKTLDGIKWQSTDKTVGIIDSALGEFTALKAGSTTIIASKDGFDAGYLTILVTDESLPNLVLTSSTDTLKVGESTILTLKDSKGNEVEGATFESSSTNVAIVSSKGVVSAKGEGTTIITASKDGYNSANIKLTVEAGSGPVTPSDVFTINYKKTSGVEFNGPTSAKAGDTIKFSVRTTQDGIEIQEVKVNGVTKNKINDEYQFVMPNEAVVVEARIKVSNAPVSVAGDLTFPLVLNNEGIYESDSISISQDSSLTFYVKDKFGNDIPLDYRNNDGKNCFDFKRCFSKLTFDSSEQFRVPGGFSYIFYYDPVSTNCFIKRDQVLTIPTNTKTLENLFDGGNSTQTIYPSDVKSLSYKNYKYNEDYEFNRYANNTSIASIDDMSVNKKHIADVYKSIENINGKDTLRVVDSYVETTNYSNSITDNGIDNDQISSRYAGLYNIYESKNDFPANSANYSYTRNDAEFMANMYSHSYFSLEMEFAKAYRYGFSIQDEVKFTKLDINSKADVGGGFTTTVDSYKTLVDSTSPTDNVHIEYDITIKFDSMGRILEGSFVSEKFKDDAYDFSKDKFLTGGENLGVIDDNVEFKYEYSTTLTEAPTFDYSSFFINNISKVTINDTSINKDASKNMIKRGAIIGSSQSYCTPIELEYEATTALDTWQYGVVASSNENVIAPRNNASNEYEAIYSGTSTISIGNHSTNHVISDCVVEVPSGKEFWDWNFYNAYPYDDQILDTKNVVVYAGENHDFDFRCSPADGDNTVSKIELSRNDLIHVEYNSREQLLSVSFVDGYQNITIPEEGIKITLNVYSNFYDKGATTPWTGYITVLPKGPFSVSQMVGTWKNASTGYTAVFLEEAIQISGKTYNKGIITADTNKLTIGWTVDNLGYLDYHVASYEGTYTPIGHNFDIFYESTATINEKIAIAWTLEVWLGQDSGESHDIIGYNYPETEDSEEYVNAIEFIKQ